MDFGFFEAMSRSEAEGWQTRFREVGRVALPEFIAAAASSGIKADFSIESVPVVIAWAAGQASATAREPDLSLPDWIRSSETYEKYLFDFDETSKSLILSAAYYLGESFVRGFPSLSWGIGARDTALQGQPVVGGFRGSAELPVLLVTENLFARVVADEPDGAGIEKATETWVSKVGVGVSR